MRKHERQYKEVAPDLMATVCGWGAPSFDVPSVEFSKVKDGIYERWVNENYLRINRFCDVDQFSQLSLPDNVGLPDVRETEERKKLFETSFAEIKRVFVDTRKIIFQAIVGDRDVNTELLKMSYKNLYSIFDKIAVFLQAYLKLPIEVYQVDFAKILVRQKEQYST